MSKAIGVPLAKLAAKVMAGKKLAELGFTRRKFWRKYWAVKESVFPFNRFHGQDIFARRRNAFHRRSHGPGRDLGIALRRNRRWAANSPLPLSGRVFISVSDADKPHVAAIAHEFAGLGFELVSTSGTAAVLEKAGLKVQRIS